MAKRKRSMKGENRRERSVDRNKMNESRTVQRIEKNEIRY
jgi:hypothetical protein